MCSRLGVDLSGGTWEEEQEEEDGSNPFVGVVAARVRGREWWQSLRFERLTDCVVSGAQDGGESGKGTFVDFKRHSRLYCVGNGGGG